jgi:hypothetical protein
MLTPRSRILWGVGLENPLDFAWAIDSFVPTRKPRAGSQRVAITGAGYDTWVTGRDYHMAGVARYLEAATGADPLGVASGWEAAAGVEEFLTWAGDGNQFTFVPDVVNAPDFTVPSCWLEDPFEPEPTPEEDGTLAQALRICNATVPFGQAMRGIMFEYAPGASLTDPVAATFTRASVATRIAKLLGLEPLATEAANVLRDRHYEGSVKTALLESARENLIENGDYETDTVGTAVVVATFARDATNVRRGSWAGKLTTTNTGGSGCFWSNRSGTRIAVTVGQPYTHSIWVYAPAASVGKTFTITLEWYTSAPAANGSSQSGTLTLVAGWQRLNWTGTPPASTATCTPTFYTTAAIGVFDVWVDMVQFEAGAFASSAISTGTGAVTRSADAFSWPFLYKPQAMFALIEFVERGQVVETAVSHAGLQIGSSGGNRFLLFDEAGSAYRVLWTDNVSFRRSSPSGTPAAGDTVALLATLAANGALTGRKSINSGAETVGSTDTALALPAAWGAQALQIGPGTIVPNGFIAPYRVKIGPLTFGGVTRDTIAKALAA